MLLSVLLLVPFASAHDFDLKVVVPTGEQVTMTIRDADSRPLPVVIVPTESGPSYRVSANLVSTDAGDYKVDFVIESVSTDRRGRLRSEVVAQPTMLAHADQVAEFQMGSERLSPEDPSQIIFEGYTIEWAVRTDPT